MLQVLSQSTGRCAREKEHSSKPWANSTTFHWGEWVDTSQESAFIAGVLVETALPTLAGVDLHGIPAPLTRPSTPQEHAMAGALYVKHFMPPPRQVALLASGTQADTELFTLTGEGRFELSHIRETPAAPVNVFAWDFPQMLADAASQSAGLDAFSWFVSMAGAIDRSGKYFREVELRNDPLAYGSHYDWRFFGGIQPNKEHRVGQTKMLRAWAKFVEAFDLEYWIAHGSLLGWYWNGFRLPWDSDIDLQMPIQTPHRLAQDLNNTLVVDSSSDGDTAYLVDVSPWYIQRVKGTGKNVIDARFIDIHTGLYIDITGLAETKASGEYNCKNYHYYTRDQLYPLRETVFEGVRTYVPRDVLSILRDEYNLYEKPRFEDWRWSEDLSVWLRDTSCNEVLAKFSASALVHCNPTDLFERPDCDVTVPACRAGLEDRYSYFIELSQLHHDEQLLWTAQHDVRRQRH